MQLFTSDYFDYLSKSILMNDEMGWFGKGRLKKIKGIAEDRFIYYTIYRKNQKGNCFTSENVKFHPTFSHIKPIICK